MNQKTNYTEDQATNSVNEFKQWSTPELYISNIENITEGGTFPPASGDDGFYQS